VIPPAVDLERFTPSDRAPARARFGIDPNAFLAVAARRLDARMGLDSLLAAWERVQREHADAVLLIAGDGPERAVLEAQRAALQQPDGVRLLGPVGEEDLIDLYRAADCSVVPSRALEGFGLVVLESLACGTPAIVTDVGGLPEAVAGFDESLVVARDDPRALADRLLDVAAGDRPSDTACRAHAERFRWDDVARRHLELYAQVAVKHRPRVVYLDHCAQLSGGELALARMLRVLDVDSHVILAEDGPLVERLREVGVSVEVLPMAEEGRGLRRDRIRANRLPVGGVLASALYSARLAQRLRTLRPDLVHTNSLKAALYGGVAGRIAGVPVVWHVRDRIADDYLPAQAVRLVRGLSRILPSAVIANSHATLHTLGRMHKSAVIYDSVDGARIMERRRNDVLRIGMVGRLTPWKGQHIFLDAFARAFADGDERAVVVGGALFGARDMEYGNRLRDQAARLGISERLEVRGHIDDIGAVYESLDVLVHASTVPEPFGQVVVEGMAAGLAVVAADAAGPAETITDGVDGLLYPPGDRAELAERLRRLAGDPGLRARLGEEGMRRAADFTPERAAAEVLRLYERILTRERT
jgi:glycosyltransferase involved in cell wall biosynthesis